MVNSITHNSDFIKEISVTSQVIEIINLIFETAFTGFPAVEGQVIKTSPRITIEGINLIKKVSINLSIFLLIRLFARLAI